MESPKMDRSADVVTESRPARCPEHGAFESRNIIGRVWSECPACARIKAELRRIEEAAESVAAANERHRRMIDAAAIPARFVGRTFESFVADMPGKVHALSAVRDFVESFDQNARRGAGLILAGLPGTGKSHLAGAALQALLPRQVRYMTCLDLIRSIRDTWRRDSERSETQVLAYLRGLDLLAIDEIGVQYGTDGEQTVLFEVLDQRYREVKPTILLTNQDRAGFKGFVGERTYDRLVETCRWVPFDWPSYRTTARRESAA